MASSFFVLLLYVLIVYECLFEVKFEELFVVLVGIELFVVLSLVRLLVSSYCWTSWLLLVGGIVVFLLFWKVMNGMDCARGFILWKVVWLVLVGLVFL